jgi:hypothetical protein
MYAAGHPPLPSIEVASFSEEEPRHWQYLREKPGAIQQRLGFQPGRLEQSELVAVSALTGLSAWLEMFAASTEQAALGKEPMDFARYDCFACHHELRTAGRPGRPMRGAKGGVGRPTVPNWPFVLLRVGLEAADPERAQAWNQALQCKLQELDDALTERPFGDLAKAPIIAREIIARVNEPLGVLERLALGSGEGRQVVDQVRASRMLEAIGIIAAERTLDYDSSRQLAWAFRSIYSELALVTKKTDPDVKTVLDHMDETLQMSLNPGPPASRKPIMDSLARRLGAVAEYNPLEFQKDMCRLAKLGKGN